MDKIYPSGIILVGQISDVRDVMTEKELSDLVGYSYPAALPVEGRPGWLRRYWVLRTSREIDEATCVTLGDLVTRNIRTALLESSVPVAVLDRGAPVIAVNMLDARHAIVRTDFYGAGQRPELGRRCDGCHMGRAAASGCAVGDRRVGGISPAILEAARLGAVRVTAQPAVAAAERFGRFAPSLVRR